MLETCTKKQKNMLLNETAITKIFILVVYRNGDGKGFFSTGSQATKIIGMGNAGPRVAATVLGGSSRVPLLCGL